jgi:hypothetical protein
MKKLAIVCGAPSSEMLAPFNDPAYEVWVLGNRSQNYPRYDLIFEIHDEVDEEHDERYPQWLADKNIPMVVGKNFPIKADHIKPFPFKAARELTGELYLTSSPAMMVCYAMLKGYPYMELYGVDLQIDDFEYFWQRPCMEFWIGFARGKGHEVVLHETSPVCKANYVEGLASGGRPDFSKPPFTEEGFLGLAKRHQDKIAAAQAQIAQLQGVIQSNDGARQAYAQMARVARSVEAGNDVPSLDITVRQKD